MFFSVFVFNSKINVCFNSFNPFGQVKHNFLFTYFYNFSSCL